MSGVSSHTATSTCTCVYDAAREHVFGALQHLMVPQTTLHWHTHIIQTYVHVHDVTTRLDSVMDLNVHVHV